MSMDLTGIVNVGEYFSDHYLSSVFEQNAQETIDAWKERARNAEREGGESDARAPYALLRSFAPKYKKFRNGERSRADAREEFLETIAEFFEILGWDAASGRGAKEVAPDAPKWRGCATRVQLPKGGEAPVWREYCVGARASAWIALATPDETSSDADESDDAFAPLEDILLDVDALDDDARARDPKKDAAKLAASRLADALMSLTEAPRFLLVATPSSVALVDREKYGDGRLLTFDLDEIFRRGEESTYKAVAVLLHRECLAPTQGAAIIDRLDANSLRHASGVSKDLKYALREAVELLGNEVLYYLKTAKGIAPESVDAEQLTLECLRYMYRMLFVLFIEARPELGYAPTNNPVYRAGYSLDALRDLVDDFGDLNASANANLVANGHYLHECFERLCDLIYRGYPLDEDEYRRILTSDSVKDVFAIPPLKAHVFDPEQTPTISGARKKDAAGRPILTSPLVGGAKLRNEVMLRIISLMSLTRESGNGKGKGSGRRGRISYANLGINQLGSVYEALLSYRGFIAKEDLYEVKREQDGYDELNVGYFVNASELEEYRDEERARYEADDPKGRWRAGDLRRYPQGTFIYRMAGREREKSASYYTPECLTQCLVKHALEELLKDKSADEILELKVCEPAMGSAAFLNETVNQLAEAYLKRKLDELRGAAERGDADAVNTLEGFDPKKRRLELQKIKMFIADRNVYGIDLNPVAVELAEVSLWLNTIYKGGGVPWFGTQLVCGNSLIGARRQCYRVADLQTKKKGAKWFEKAPERVVFGPAAKARKSDQVYHFLLGDPGMCAYDDKAIKALEPENIKKIEKWRKEFTAPYTDQTHILMLQQLCEIIDSLWKQQIADRKILEKLTRDPLSIFGRVEPTSGKCLSIREKDELLFAEYKTERKHYAGAYARLKFAMDYWCALWFWPIAKAEQLPSRVEFLVDMRLILEGLAIKGARDVSSAFSDSFGFDIKEEEEKRIEQLGFGLVDLKLLCEKYPRLKTVADIAKRNHFMHWELEFSDIFAERGGFDLILGNPPWVRVDWSEQNVLSESRPKLALREISATETAQLREEILQDAAVRRIYFEEYESNVGSSSFLNAIENYALLKGQKANLYKCFLPQAWTFGNSCGVSAFLHPEGVYDDPKGDALRERMLERVRKHFMFANARRLFPEVHPHTTFSVNVYGDPLRIPSFDSISNLFDPTTIDECYDQRNATNPTPGLKDDKGGWSLAGHPRRVIKISQEQLTLFSSLFEEGANWKSARIPVLHSMELYDVLSLFTRQPKTLGKMNDEVFMTKFWNETDDQKRGIFYAKKDGDYILSEFPKDASEAIYVSPNIRMLNPCGTSTRKRYKVNSDYDTVDLTEIPENYLIRCKYRPNKDHPDFERTIPKSAWGKITEFYRIISRLFVGTDLERTLTCAIAPRAITHVNAVFDVCIKNCMDMVCLAGCEASLPYDLLVKSIGKANIMNDVYNLFPVFNGEEHLEIVSRTLLMNCLTNHFADLWRECWRESYREERWSKSDKRLDDRRFSELTGEWSWGVPLRTDYERRQALVELDVLVSQTLGMTLDQLKTIYRIQFPVLQSHEANTWYDATGRIVFTNNTALRGVGLKRDVWEKIKDAPAGYSHRSTIIDDTLPGGPRERVITYEAPFDRCDRERDYEVAWEFFERRKRR